MTIPNPPAPGATIGPLGRTRLVDQGAQAQPMTDVQETDARMALTRGLAEYLEPLESSTFGGGRIRFKAVHDEFSEPEQSAKYPSIAITLQGPGEYAPSSMSPVLDPKCRLPAPDGRYAISHAEFVQDVSVECWCTSPEERIAACIMLERAFNPLPNRYGFQLQLPHYFNTRGSFTLKSLTIQDDPDQDLRRFRVASFTLTARIPIIALFTFPDAKPSFDLQGASPSLDVLFTIEVT